MNDGLPMPPHNADAERYVLGSLMSQPGEVFELIDGLLTREDFYVERHARLFELLGDLWSDGTPLELVAIAEALQASDWWKKTSSNEHPAVFVGDLVVAAVNPLNADYYAKLIAKKARLRKIGEAASSLARRAYESGAELDDLAGLVDPQLFEMPSARERFPVLTSAELDDGDDDIEYLIDGVLVKGQPGGVFGGRKSLKTNILIDMALSLAQVARDHLGNESGGLFLGQFKVTRPCRVALLSGESGQKTIRETARRIAKAKRWPLRNFEGIAWGFNLPRLGEKGDLLALRRFIRQHRSEVLVIDPAYLCMNLGNDAGNLFAVGEKLIGLTELAQEFDCTPLLCHHTKQASNRIYEPPELDDIAWAGFQEWVRQWILVGRREKYDPEGSGHHKLWLNIGGSAGHSSVWAVNITEGTRQDKGGRRWDVEVLNASRARAQAAEEQADAVDQRKQERELAAMKRDRERLLERLRRHPHGETETVIRGTLDGGRFHVVMETLIEDGMAETCEVFKPPRKSPYHGYRPTSTTTGRNWANGRTPGAPGGVDQGAGELPPLGGSPVSHCSPRFAGDSPGGLQMRDE